uniref:Zn(2)-C6 fungal-type domain-containing protein n=1 Tax=Kwoniella pini CBS 10737 TaxID=1296096 RepID=A0A1B9HYJ0_9TREE|nr:uncharacterized protein I206_06176 [Kwoniella pini CBS 10737]OCF48308.1 hypothetical protein I206_06176 [Kwoniella pini CBS 10737]
MSVTGDIFTNGVAGSSSTRSKLACAACRQNKVRCLRNEGLDHACMRCLRYGLACTAPPINKRRGRPRRESSNGNSKTTSYTPPLASASSLDPAHSFWSMERSLGHFSQDILPSSSNGINTNEIHHNLAPTLTTNSNLHHMIIAQPDAIPSFPVAQSSPLSSEAEATGPNRNLDLSEYLDPADRPIHLAGPNAPFFLNNTPKSPTIEGDENSLSELRDDPEAEATALVKLFHDRLNHLVAVLDYKLHTLSYLRRTSTVLFTAVIAVASKFSRPDLHHSLLSHAQTLLTRSINNGVTDVAVVQSIMILMYWKLPADTSSWRKIGIAIRMGYQLYWHVPRTQSLPKDDTAARKILNAERTWMCLFCFDRSLSHMYGLPAVIQPNHLMDPANWAREHTYIGPSVDVHLASSIELCKLKDQWRAICDSTTQSSAYNDAALDSVLAQSEALLCRYWRKEAPPIGFEYEKEHVGLWSTLDFMLVLKRHYLEASPNDPIRIDACLSYASRITDQIDEVANNGDLEIMQDTSSVMASSLTVLLRKMFHLSSLTQKTLIINLLRRILTAYTRAAGMEHNTAPAYVARFVQRTLRAIGMESKAGSPMREQAGISDGMLGGEQPDFMAQLQQFMVMPDETTALNDEDYW